VSLQRQEDIEIIISRGAILRNMIETSSALNLMSIHVTAENFFRDLLNLLLGYDLVNLNMVLANSAAIDLGDESKKVCIQVTATADKSKIDKTVKKFVEKGLNNQYSRLIMLIVTKKKKYQSDTISDPTGAFKIDVKSDIWDWDEIAKFANDLSSEKLHEVREFMEAAIKVVSSNIPQKEVATFIDLMLILSNESHEEAGKGILTEPDPAGKIETRFSQHAEYLLDQYALHYSEYGSVLAETLKDGDLGSARMRRLGLHLSSKSDKILSESDGDPKQALERLVGFYLSSLQSFGKNSDEGAVRFFMLDQMIKCHVFPNPRLLSA